MWVNETTGMLGYTQLYDLTNLKPAGPSCNEGASTPTCLEGSNGIAAQLKGGLLWVTQIAGGPARNFCGNPDGQVLASLPVPNNDGVLEIDTENNVILVLTSQLSADKGQTFTEEPIPKESY